MKSNNEVAWNFIFSGNVNFEYNDYVSFFKRHFENIVWYFTTLFLCTEPNLFEANLF